MFNNAITWHIRNVTASSEALVSFYVDVNFRNVNQIVIFFLAVV